jgi:hypothetical protein
MYGLASAPGIRHSMRNESPRPTTRKPAVRLSWLQAMLVGAKELALKRLYEVTSGAKQAVSSRAWAISPPRNQR